jgi:hypothetical protein
MQFLRFFKTCSVGELQRMCQWHGVGRSILRQKQAPKACSKLGAHQEKKQSDKF